MCSVSSMCLPPSLLTGLPLPHLLTTDLVFYLACLICSCGLCVCVIHTQIRHLMRMSGLDVVLCVCVSVWCIFLSVSVCTHTQVWVHYSRLPRQGSWSASAKGRTRECLGVVCRAMGLSWVARTAVGFQLRFLEVTF